MLNDTTKITYFLRKWNFQDPNISGLLCFVVQYRCKKSVPRAKFRQLLSSKFKPCAYWYIDSTTACAKSEKFRHFPQNKSFKISCSINNDITFSKKSMRIRWNHVKTRREEPVIAIYLLAKIHISDYSRDLQILNPPQLSVMLTNERISFLLSCKICLLTLLSLLSLYLHSRSYTITVQFKGK